MGVFGTEYITLTNSNVSLSKKFAVVSGGYKISLEANHEIVQLVGGGYDLVEGSIYEFHRYTLMVRHTEPETGYGTLGDLETFFRLRNPNATPSNRLTLVDNQDTSHTVFMIGKLERDALTTAVKGNQAWFYVPVEFYVISTP